MNTVTPAEALAQLQALLAVLRGPVELRLEGRGFEHRWRLALGPAEQRETPPQGRQGQAGKG